MKNLLLALFLTCTYIGNAQHTISGNFSPAKDFKWVVAYQLKSGNQAYVADTALRNGAFELNIKEDADPGTYRLVYGIPQDQHYFDVIYNGKEDIQLAFDANNGVTFIASEENKLFTAYFDEITNCEQEIVSFYSAKNPDKTQLSQLIGTLKEIQSTYEARSANLICHQYIVANNPYIPTLAESPQEYMSNKKAHYFQKIDYKNTVLQNSNFLTDKTVNYVLTAMPVDELSEKETEVERQKNINKIHGMLQNVDAKYATYLLYTLWSALSHENLNETSDFLYGTYLEKLAVQTKNQKLIDYINTHNRLRIGAMAPEIAWDDNGASKKLSQLETNGHIVLVFWSSGCPHCLEEVPKLHQALSGNTTTQVVAIGLEDNDRNWKKEIAKLEDFHHALALGKWQNKYVAIYGVHQTPTYFILDKDKKIVHKPTDYQEALTFLKK